MNVLILKANEDALTLVPDFEHSLENMQNVVGGNLEALDLSYDEQTGRRITLWLNEEGKLIGLPVNFALLHQGQLIDIVMGDCIITAVDEDGRTVSLSESEIQFIKQKVFDTGIFFIPSIGIFEKAMRFTA